MTFDKKKLLESSINTARLARLIAKAVDLFIGVILSLVFYPVGVIFAIGYLCVSDSLYDGQSFGKKLMGLAVISVEDGGPCSLKQSVIRNLPLIVPFIFALIPLWGWIFSGVFGLVLIAFETYLLFKLDTGRRLGDEMADTSVIGNDPDHIENNRANQSWFAGQKNMSPVNRGLM